MRVAYAPWGDKGHQSFLVKLLQGFHVDFKGHWFRSRVQCCRALLIADILFRQEGYEPWIVITR